MHQWFMLGFILAAVTAGPVSGVAQDYPKKGPLRLIVPQSPGSATDIMARALAARLSEILGQQVVVDNRAGAGGLVGTEAVAKAPPDGYTLGIANISTHGVNPGLYKSLPYDPIADFAPVGLTAVTGNVLIVSAAQPFRTVGELIAHAKAHPNTLMFATAGPGSSQHLATELFNAMAGGLKMLHVPYRGTTPGLTAVMANEVAWMMPAIPSGMTAIKTGKARPIGVSTAQRHKELPDVPTIAETLPGFEVVTWFGVVAPARTPASVIATLNEALAKALGHPELQRQFAGAGLDPTSSTPEAFAAFIRSEIARWTKVARDANITIE